MQYQEIIPKCIFSSKVMIDEDNGWIVYRNMVIGIVERLNGYVKYILNLPIIKDADFNDLSIDVADIFSDLIRIDARGSIFLLKRNCYVKIGYDGTNIEIILPYFCDETN